MEKGVEFEMRIGSIEEKLEFVLRPFRKIEEKEKYTFSKYYKAGLLIGSEKYQHKDHYFGNYSDLIFSIKRFSKAYDH